MDATAKFQNYGTIRSAKIVRQIVWSTEMIPATQLGEVRSVPAGVDTAEATKRYRNIPGRELPVEMSTTAGSGTVKVPGYVSNQR